MPSSKAINPYGLALQLDRDLGYSRQRDGLGLAETVRQAQPLVPFKQEKLCDTEPLSLLLGPWQTFQVSYVKRRFVFVLRPSLTRYLFNRHMILVKSLISVPWFLFWRGQITSLYCLYRWSLISLPALIVCSFKFSALFHTALSPHSLSPLVRDKNTCNCLNGWPPYSLGHLQTGQMFSYDYSGDMKAQWLRV